MAKKYEAKTTATAKRVDSFLDEVEPETKRDDCRAIMKMMAEASKEPAKMWGPSIVGFGTHHYEYESGHSGDICKIGFAPRKGNIVLYLNYNGVSAAYDAEVKKLGKYKTSKACIYINKLADVDTGVLKKLMKLSLDSLDSQKKQVSKQSKK